MLVDEANRGLELATILPPLITGLLVLIAGAAGTFMANWFAERRQTHDHERDDELRKLDLARAARAPGLASLRAAIEAGTDAIVRAENSVIMLEPERFVVPIIESAVEAILRARIGVGALGAQDIVEDLRVLYSLVADLIVAARQGAQET